MVTQVVLITNSDSIFEINPVVSFKEPYSEKKK